MKKFLSLALVLAMVMSLSVTAFATSDKSITPTGTYEGESTAAVLSVEYSHGDMKFTYSASNKGTWDSTTHTYSDGSDTATWAPTVTGNNMIKVTNHSNVAITAEFVFTANSSLDGITGEFTNSTLTIASAEGTAVDSAPSGTTYFNITDGALAEGDTDVQLGTIIINIDKA